MSYHIKKIRKKNRNTMNITTPCTFDKVIIELNKTYYHISTRTDRIAKVRVIELYDNCFAVVETSTHIKRIVDIVNLFADKNTAKQEWYHRCRFAISVYENEIKTKDDLKKFGFKYNLNKNYCANEAYKNRTKILNS